MDRYVYIQPDLMRCTPIQIHAKYTTTIELTFGVAVIEVGVAVGVAQGVGGNITLGRKVGAIPCMAYK